MVIPCAAYAIELGGRVQNCFQPTYRYHRTLRQSFGQFRAEPKLRRPQLLIPYNRQLRRNENFRLFIVRKKRLADSNIILSHFTNFIN